MDTLNNILKSVKALRRHGDANPAIAQLAIDSRVVKPGALFAAITGVHTNGHLFIDKAIAQGAVAIICEQWPAQLQEHIVYLQVPSSAEAIAWCAHEFYNQPSAKLTLVGVTGTNGKTTIATLLYKLYTQLGYTCGLISTVQNHIGSQILPSQFTTPDAISVNALLAQMAHAGCTHVFMECSSHAIHQHRITGLQFDGAIFSNITHDHLDYHKTFDEYIRVKKSFFDHLSPNAFALSNADDKRGLIMLQNTVAKRLLYSLRSAADFKGKIRENNLTGLVMEVDGREVHFRLIGEFNAYNLLAVYGAALSLGQQKDEVLAALSGITGAEGRFDYVVSTKDKIIGIVDYAHTPDALLNVLATIKKLRRADERVIAVVGCGGDRDKTKRPLMAAAACEYSHVAILTSDNPRTEDPMAILADMQQGMKSEHKRRCRVMPDRREAIREAITMANPGDIVLIAGKGHEKYQEVNGVKHHFDDKEELLDAFATLKR